MEIVLAIVVGASFGFALDRVGATNPGYIIRMLNLTDMHLMKTILLAVGVATILLFAGLLTGLVAPSHLSVKSAYVGVFIGGLLLGAGFAVAGYCPGTSLTALATGRLDAAFFVVGGLAGAFAYMLSFAWVQSTGVLAGILGGRATLGQISGTKFPALLATLPGEILGLAAGMILILVAAALPDRLASGKADKAAAAE